MASLVTASQSQQGPGGDINRQLGASAAELIAVTVLLAIYQLADPADNPDLTHALNIAGPIWLGIVLAFGAWRIARNVRNGVWAPLFWFRIATITYFCVGSLVPLLGSDETREYVEALFAFQPHHVLKLNIITAFSVLVVLGTSTVLDAFGRRVSTADAGQEGAALAQQPPILPFALGFLLVGSAIKFLLVLPNQLGWTETVIPGALATLGETNLIGYFLLTIWCLDGRQKFLAFVLALVAFEIAIGLLTFNKASVLFPVIVVALGLLHRRVTLARGAAIVVVVAASLSFLQPLVAHSRLVQVMLYQSPTGGTLEQRLQILESYLDPTAASVEERKINHTLARISYVNVATFVIDQYDRGQPGNLLDGLFIMLVPRFLWPDKPIFVPGADLWMLMTGLEGNQVGAGIFAEAYWNFGWAGVPLLMIPFGIILYGFSRLAVSVMGAGNWLFMPVLFMGMKMGVRIDGTYIIDVVGATAIAIVVSAIFAYLNPYLSARSGGTISGR